MDRAATKPDLGELIDSSLVASIPMKTRFRGVTLREVMLLKGPFGWSEFSPFLEYEDREASAWLRAAIEFGWSESQRVLRESIPVNATLPAVPAEKVAEILDNFPGCRTVKVKVAEPGQSLEEETARVAAARKYLGPQGRLRVDANGGWSVSEAERAIRELAGFDLEYAEQPCRSVGELVQLRSRIEPLGVKIAADESVRKAEDPLAVAKAGAADLLVIKAQPLGGIRAALKIVEEAGLPVVVSSALDSSIGIAMGAHLAAALPELPFDCGLGTAALLQSDVVADPLLPANGQISVSRPEVDEAAFNAVRVGKEREQWWRTRLERCYRLLS
ncbi:MAG: o-succinylbenzoate synthase [Cryobacterium sp.]|nr:o-succinylbenzoate synthase [Cryobacterium sp.]